MTNAAIDLNNLTLGQIREITKLAACVSGAGVVGGVASDPEAPTAIGQSMVGKYVVVRCRDAGVHCGVLAETNGRACVLTESRRLWYWKVKGTGAFLNGIALTGVHSSSKLSAPVGSIHLTENCEIIECTKEAEASLRAQAIHNA